MGGTVERRLGALEEAFGDQLRASEPDELRRQLFREALRRLSYLELCVLEELCVAYQSRPEASPANMQNELTDAQRAMETRWRDVVTAVAKEGIDADEGLLPERREVLKRDVVLAVANAPFYRRLADGAA